MDSIGNLEKIFKEVCGEWLKSNNFLSVRGEQGIFSSALIVWLGIQQRLKGGSTLHESLQALLERLEVGEIDFLISRPNQKLRKKDISLNTGGVSRARDRVTEEMIVKLCEAANRNIQARFSKYDTNRPIYLLDGQVTAASRSESNLKSFGRIHHGFGELHYPHLRIIAAHKLSTGIATNSVIGSYKDSEIKLSKDLFKELPKESLLVMDRGFHSPAFLEAAREHHIHVLVRLRGSKGAKLLAESKKTSGIVAWKTKTDDDKTIVLNGRIIHLVSEIKGFRSSEFYIFCSDTTINEQEISDLYRQRVKVEVFIRDLKQKLNLVFIRAKKAENINKEIRLAYLTFNLLRAIMYETAVLNNVDISRLSFSTTMRLCQTYSGAFLKNPRENQNIADRFQKHLLQAKLPLRKSPRSFPRIIKRSRDKYEAKPIFKPVKTEIGK